MIPQYSSLDEHDPYKFPIGKTVIAVHGLKIGSELVTFVLADGSLFEVQYHHDCCASCSILDMDCEEGDFVGSKILNFEIATSEEDPADLKALNDGYRDSFASFTWSFVKFTTSKGHFTMRWYGESNGYYSETPSVSALKAEHARDMLRESDLVLLDKAMENGIV